MPAVMPGGVQSIQPTTESCCGFIVERSRVFFFSTELKSKLVSSCQMSSETH